MASPGARAALPPNPRQRWLTHLASCFERVAASITGHRPEAELMVALDEIRTLCAGVMPNGSHDAQDLLPRLKMAVETWQSVWGRLGAQQEFRLAVAREAQLWARWLRTMGEDTSTSSRQR